jgi:isopenicillin N synthase-like dioxygenase
MISNSLASCHAAKARLLYYFPTTTPQEEATSGSSSSSSTTTFDDWCGWHKDHGSLTALLPGMLCGSSQSDGDDDSSSTSPSAGLYIQTRQGELVHAALSSSSLGFQLGETLQIMSRGRFRATPHAVKAPTITSTKSKPTIGRASLAVFLQPLPNQPLPHLPRAGTSHEDDSNDRFSLQRRWRPTFGAFQKATTDTFN